MLCFINNHTELYTELHTHTQTKAYTKTFEWTLKTKQKVLEKVKFCMAYFCKLGRIFCKKEYANYLPTFIKKRSPIKNCVTLWQTKIMKIES